MSALPRASLLNLPGEIRNTIFEYALTASAHLRPTSSFYKKCIIQPALNQLQFVNRQLHAETRDLEIRYNCLEFRSSWWPYRATPVQCAEYYFANMPEYKRCWVREVAIEGKDPFDHRWLQSLPWLPELTTFCQTYPNIRIKYICPLWLQKEDRMERMYIAIKIGSDYSLALRGDVLPHLFGLAEDMQRQITFYQARLEGLGRLDNFRVYPAVDALPETWESEECKAYWEGISVVPEGGIEVWVRAVKGWIEHGI